MRIIFASQTASNRSISFFEIPEFLVATVIIIAFLNFEHYCSGGSCKIRRRVKSEKKCAANNFSWAFLRVLTVRQHLLEQ